jgi:hypothetical protein
MEPPHTPSMLAPHSLPATVRRRLWCVCVARAHARAAQQVRPQTRV